MQEGTPGSRHLAAVLQLNSTSDAEGNWRVARDLVERAAAAGAKLVATPENTNFLGPHDEKVRRAEGLDGETCGRFSGLARERMCFGCWKCFPSSN